MQRRLGTRDIPEGEESGAGKAERRRKDHRQNLRPEWRPYRCSGIGARFRLLA
jgi:hypothetical protein